MTKQKSVSIILVNWNSFELTKNCIRTIKENTDYPNYEICVVDNGSIDGSAKKLKKEFPDVKIIKNSKNMGFAYALNQGYKDAGTPLVGHMNSDAVVLKGWLTNAVKVFESDPKIAVAGVREVSAAQAIDPQKLAQIQSQPNIEKMTLPVGWVTSKEVIEKVGFLDAEFFSPAYGEEADWNFRARRLGYKIVRASKSNVVHHGSAIIRKAMGNKKYVTLINYHRLRAMFFNLSILDLARFVPGMGLIFVNSILDGTIFFLLKAYWLNLSDWKLILEQRKKKRAFIPFKEPKFTVL